MKTVKIIYMILLFLLTGSLFAGTLQEDRQYEAVIFTQQEVGGFDNVSVNEIFAYSYNATTDTWTLIPFQIDEQTLIPDPLSASGEEKWFYFLPPDTTHDGVFHNHDELVFMVKDLGDKAPDRNWPDNDDAKLHDRLELKVYSPADESQYGYLYLLQSSTLSQDDIPTPYNMSFDEITQTISTVNYDFQFGDPGLIETIKLKTNGSSYDILDRLKARVMGVFNTAFGPIELTLDEEIMSHTDLWVTSKPVVRLLHQTNYKLNLPGLDELDNVFTVKTKFYPYTGTIFGGDTLTPETIAKHMEDPIEIRFKDLRFSWDFNENASGMQFFSPNNNNIPVDGSTDNVDKTISIPQSRNERITLWGLTTGNQGTVFSYSRFSRSTWDDVEMYYFDNQNGGQADDDIFNTPETGDGMSYGDYGMLFTRDEPTDTIDFTLDFTLHMLPVQNMDQNWGTLFAHNIDDTLKATRRIVTDINDATNSTLPSSINLYQNYPNPFNNSTRFKFDLDKTAPVKLEIFDATGRLVDVLVNSTLGTGPHTLHWQGTNSQGVQLPSGVYFYQLSVESKSLRQKLLLLR